MLKRLIPLAVLFFVPPAVAAATPQGRANIYVHNTGDEAVWAASAERVDGYTKVQVRGWRAFQPGEKGLLCTKDFAGEVAVAFSKRGGYPIYAIDAGSASKRGIREVFVKPEGQFNVVYDPDGVPPGPEFASVQTSFAFFYEAGSKTFEQTVTVPSMKADTVQPMAIPVLPTDFSGQPATYDVETAGLKRWRNRGGLMLQLAELYKSRSKRKEFQQRVYDDVYMLAETAGFDYDDARSAESIGVALAGFTRALGRYDRAIGEMAKMGPEWRPSRGEGWNQLARMVNAQPGVLWIHLAALADNAEVVADELGRGVDPEVRDAAGRTPVFIAMQEGSARAAQVLLERGAKITSTNAEGRTLLMLAASKNAHEQVDLLLEAGADPNAADAAGRTAVHDAAASGATASLALLLEHGGRVDVRAKSGSTPLHDAAAGQARDAAALLLEAGAGLEVKGAWGRTPFLTAADDATRTLLAEAGANVNAQDDKGKTALHLYFGSAVSALLKLGLDPKVVDSQGATALHLACQTPYYVAPVDALLLAGVDVNAKDAEGYTPLHRAAYANAIPAIQSLGKAGADLAAKTNRGQTALQIALEQSWRADAAAALRALGAKE